MKYENQLNLSVNKYNNFNRNDFNDIYIYKTHLEW